LFVILIAPSILARDYSARTHYYAVEYLKPNAGSGEVSILNVILNRRLEAAAAERILREELQRAVILFPPKGEIMAYALSETEAASGSEQRIALPDGSNFLIYSPNSKRIQTEKQYSASREKPPQLGKGLNVELHLEIERGNDGRVRIVGKTNLPNGMTLMLGLRDTASKYFAQDKVEVLNSQFVSAWFSEGGKPLRPSTYQISVSSPLPDLQPQAVRARIGEKGENLSGSVRSWMGSKMIEYTVRKTLK